MEKGYILGIVFALFLVGVFAYASIPNPGHGGNNVTVSVEGVQKYLQTAIDDGSLMSGAIVSAASPATPTGHSGDQVMITINSLDMTLQTAIDEDLFVCAIPNSYSGTLSVYSEWDSSTGNMGRKTVTCAPGYGLISSPCVKMFDGRGYPADCVKNTFINDIGLEGVSCTYFAGIPPRGYCEIDYTCTKN